MQLLKRQMVFLYPRLALNHYVTEDDFEPLVLLPLPPEGWD